MAVTRPKLSVDALAAVMLPEVALQFIDLPASGAPLDDSNVAVRTLLSSGLIVKLEGATLKDAVASGILDTVPVELPWLAL